MPRLPLLMTTGVFAVTSALSAASAAPSFSFTQPNGAVDGDLVIYLGTDAEMSGTLAAVDQATDGRLSAAMEQQEFSGKFGSTLTLHAMAPYETVLLIGTGEEELTVPKLQALGGHAAAKADDDGMTLLAEGLDTAVEAPGAYIAQGFALRSYNFDKYKFDSKDEAAPAIRVMSDNADAASVLYATDLAHVVEGVVMARDLGTEPGNKVYPEVVADRVRKAFDSVDNVRIDVLDARAIRREGMGALMGVGQGSIHDPRLVVITYNGGAEGDVPLALVGKGITFDTGGISIKGNNGMWLMKSDLSGAAAVAGTMLAAAKREAPINLVGIMPMAENMPSQDAIRPGDVLTTMGGKTIEIMSTDAEGRLLLADAVQYAQEKFEPRMLVNIATLTGSAARAVGDDYAVIVTREMEMSLEMMEVGKRAGEEVWPLPLHPSHFTDIKSDIADIKNTAGSPGASIGAAVVGTFIDEDLPWVHLDIAGVDWLNSSTPIAPKGHAGWGVRFMDQLVREETSD